MQSVRIGKHWSEYSSSPKLVIRKEILPEIRLYSQLDGDVVQVVNPIGLQVVSTPIHLLFPFFFVDLYTGGHNLTGEV